jgi:predicted nucleotidyltransferase
MTNKNVYILCIYRYHMIKQSILTEMEKEVINKKLNNEKLTKQDSYYLSKSIRPKLKQIEELSKKNLLERVGYNPKAKIIEKNIVKLILKEIKGVKAIILYGSVVQTNYLRYNDIDLLIITKDKLVENNWRKNDIINDLEDKANKAHLRLDIQILDIKTFLEIYTSNPSLIYQMKDSKVIYGKIDIPKRIELPKIVLKMKLDWSDLNSVNPSGEEIYNCIRNTLLVRLILTKIIDNFSLSNYLIEELGKNLIRNLKENKASKTERRMAIEYLNKINEETLKEINNAQWEKIVI